MPQNTKVNEQNVQMGMRLLENDEDVLNLYFPASSRQA